MLKRFLFDDAGATAVEYVLIAATMTVMLILAAPIIATALSGSFATITSKVTSVK
ncbi:MAG: Flp family type IVb pilin [Aestuariivirga sp.]